MGERRSLLSYDEGWAAGVAAVRKLVQTHYDRMSTERRTAIGQRAVYFDGACNVLAVILEDVDKPATIPVGSTQAGGTDDG